MAESNGESERPVVAILSLGEMGFGYAQVLKSHGYRVISNIQGRSQATRERAQLAEIECMESDIDLVSQADIILSIVPPSEAPITALRVATAYKDSNRSSRPLYFVDMNAVSPETAKMLASIFDHFPGPVRFIDGAILGLPPTPPKGPDGSWTIPRSVTSGAHELPLPIREIMVMRSVGPNIGQASALKMSFATLFKGFTSLAIQSFTTAERHGIYQALKEEIDEFFPPLGTQVKEFLEGNIKNVPKKAYRWVKEMEEINETHKETGFDQGVFNAIAGIYRLVNDDTEVGRNRAKNVETEEVLKSIDEGLKNRMKQ